MMEKTTNRKSVAKRWAILAAVAFAIIVVIGGTYARYSTVGKATGTIQVAKWAVAITADDGTELEETTKPITFTVQDNDNVVAGKIAPAVTAVAEIDLDLTGTEVAVDFDAVIDREALDAAIQENADKFTFDVKVDGEPYTSGTSQLIQLPSGQAFSGTNAHKTVTLTLTWENNDNNNENDTNMGVNYPTFTIPVTLTAQQHIGTNPNP